MTNDMMFTLHDDRFGSIRVINTCDKSWFIVSDVLKVFGLDDRTHLLSWVDARDMMTLMLDTPREIEYNDVISVKGLFSMLDFMLAATLKGVLENDDLIIEMRDKISEFDSWIVGKARPCVEKIIYV